MYVELYFKGTKELRNAISKFHQRYQDIEFDAENIIVGCGSKELIFLSMMVFNGGSRLHLFIH